MGAVIFIILLALLFLLLAVFLLRGKGAWLISGYNMMSDKEKSKYDEKKLCRTTGIICLIVVALLAVMAFLGFLIESGRMAEGKMLPFALVFVAVIFVSAGIGMWYSNTQCKK